jgi:hypothetical protein
MRAVGAEVENDETAGGFLSSFFFFVRVSALTSTSWCQFPSAAAVAAVSNSNAAAMTTAAPMETGNRRQQINIHEKDAASEPAAGAKVRRPSH